MEEFAGKFKHETNEKIIKLNEITDTIVDAVFAVHRTMGPGLPESLYEECLLKEFEIRGVKCETQVKISVVYKGHQLTKYFVLDMLVANEIIVEIKTVNDLLPVHEAQLLAYLKLTNKKIGYLVNFNVPLIKNGIRRMRNGY